MSEEKHHNVHIVVNGTEHAWHENKISYQQVVGLAYGGNPPQGDGVVFTVSYFKGHGEQEGFLSPNSKPVHVKDRMEFRVKHSTRS